MLGHKRALSGGEDDNLPRAKARKISIEPEVQQEAHFEIKLQVPKEFYHYLSDLVDHYSRPNDPLSDPLPNIADTPEPEVYQFPATGLNPGDSSKQRPELTRIDRPVASARAPSVMAQVEFDAEQTETPTALSPNDLGDFADESEGLDVEDSDESEGSGVEDYESDYDSPSMLDDDQSQDGPDDYYQDCHWAKSIFGTLRYCKSESDNDKEPVGVCDGVLIDRFLTQGNFHYHLSDGTEESEEMANVLFDQYGRLRSMYMEHPFKSGSKVWGRELDTGDIFLLNYVHINKEYRRKGLATVLADAVLKKSKAMSNPATWKAVARAGVLNAELNTECYGMTADEQRVCNKSMVGANECFLRSLGFRRIGSSEWFGLAGSEHHASHSLPADKDFNTEVPRNTLSDPLKQLLELLKTHPEWSSPERLEAIQKASQSGCDWTSTDQNGETILHHVATFEDPKSAAWLVKQCPQLVDALNIEGDTPRDRALTRLGTVRSEAPGRFDGYSDAYVDILSTLSGLTTPTAEEKLRFKYGCTCGQCLLGFLSPRMRAFLAAYVDVMVDHLEEKTHDGAAFVGNETEQRFGMLRYLHPYVRNNLRTNSGMRQGFVSIMSHFGKCIAAGQVPHVENIARSLRSRTEWPPVTKTFLRRGGSIFAVGLIVFHMAVWEATHHYLDEDDLTRLPECRNDDELVFISRQCSYDIRQGGEQVEKARFAPSQEELRVHRDVLLIHDYERVTQTYFGYDWGASK